MGTPRNSPLILQFSSSTSSHNLFTCLSHSKSINSSISPWVRIGSSAWHRRRRQWRSSNPILTCRGGHIRKIRHPSCSSEWLFNISILWPEFIDILARSTCLQTQFFTFSVHHPQRNYYHNYADYLLHTVLLRCFTYLQWVFTTGLCNCFYDVASVFAGFGLGYLQKSSHGLSDFIQENSEGYIAHTFYFPLLDVYLGLSGT